MMTNDERKMAKNFQDAVSDLVDEYLRLGADPDLLTGVLRQEANSDLASRRVELEQA